MTDIATAERSFFGHPRGLFLLAAVEMWERFSFYILQMVLVLFLTSSVVDGGFGWTNREALLLAGLYSGFVYVLTPLGGWIADRYLRPHQAIQIGGWGMVVGHVLIFASAIVPAVVSSVTGLPVAEIILSSGAALGYLTIDPALQETLAVAASRIAPQTDSLNAVMASYSATGWLFYGGLTLVVIGNNLFKPSISIVVSRLYSKSDARREAAFTIFWTAINVGAFLAEITGGALGERIGWHWAFSAAGIGMLLSMVLYILKQRSWLPDHAKLQPVEEKPSIGPRSAPAKNGLVLIAIMFGFSSLFNILFFQIFGTIPLYISQELDRDVSGFLVPALWIISSQSAAVILLGPLAAIIWLRLARSGRNPSEPVKFGFGFLVLGSGFLLLSWTTGGHSVGIGLVAAMLSMCLLAAGEVSVQPIGYAVVSKYAPEKWLATLFGSWYFIYAIAGWCSGPVGLLSQSIGYERFFILLSAIAGGCGLLLLVSARYILSIGGASGPARNREEVAGEV